MKTEDAIKRFKAVMTAISGSPYWDVRPIKEELVGDGFSEGALEVGYTWTIHNGAAPNTEQWCEMFFIDPKGEKFELMSLVHYPGTYYARNGDPGNPPETELTYRGTFEREWHALRQIIALCVEGRISNILQNIDEAEMEVQQNEEYNEQEKQNHNKS